MLGQGSFGQVVKCEDEMSREIVAVKVVKNKPAYFNQGLIETKILQMVRSTKSSH
jgi:dual specificity protein kinase YAK1